jgi:hypothetical protein
VHHSDAIVLSSSIHHFYPESDEKSVLNPELSRNKYGSDNRRSCQVEIGGGDRTHPGITQAASGVELGA